MDVHLRSPEVSWEMSEPPSSFTSGEQPLGKLHLVVIQPDASKSEYLLLDGHLRVLAFKELGLNEVACLFAKDDETYSYNHRINRLSTIQEH